MFALLKQVRTPKSANGPRSNSFRPDSPSTTNFHGDGRLSQPSPHRTWSVPDASSGPQLNPHIYNFITFLTSHRCSFDMNDCIMLTEQ